MDILILKECRFECLIGIFPNERKKKQPIILDIELGIDIKKAAATDSIKNTLDYRNVHALVKKHIENNKSFLIETLTEDIAQLILKNFKVLEVTLTLRKPRPMQKRGGAWAGLKITRFRKPR